MEAVLEELQGNLEEMSPMDPDFEEMTNTFEYCKEISYLIAEGFVEVEEDETKDEWDLDRYRLFPAIGTE